LTWGYSYRVTYETDEKKAYVSILNPMSAWKGIKNDELRKVASAAEVSAKLRRVIARDAEGRWLQSKETDSIIREMIMGLSGEDESVRIHLHKSLVRMGSPLLRP
jgi:hypothetical protein